MSYQSAVLRVHKYRRASRLEHHAATAIKRTRKPCIQFLRAACCNQINAFLQSFPSRYRESVFHVAAAAYRLLSFGEADDIEKKKREKEQ